MVWEVNVAKHQYGRYICGRLGHEHVQTFDKIHIILDVPGCILLQQHSVFTK